MIVVRAGENHTWSEDHRRWFCDRLECPTIVVDTEIARLAGDDRLPCGCDAYPFVDVQERVVVEPVRKEA